MASVVVQGTTSPITVPGLAPGTYNISMQAVNVEGSSPATAPVQIVVPATTGSMVPTNITGSASGTTATINWAAPAAGTVASYNVGWTGGGTSYGPVSVAANVLTKTFTVLTPGTTYVLSVASVSSTGAVSANATIQETVPTGTSTGGPIAKGARTWLAGFFGANTAAAKTAWQTNEGYYPQAFSQFVSGTTWAAMVASINKKQPYWLPPDDTDPLSTISLLAFPLVEGTQNYNNTAIAAAGAASNPNSQAWKNMGQALVNTGLNHKSTVCRLGWEMQGWWYPWAVGKNPSAANIANWVKAFRNAAISLSSVATNVQIAVCYDTSIGGIAALNSYYPGDDVIDVVTADCYDYGGHATRSAADLESMQNGLGIPEFINFAAAHGKKFGLTEWGVGQAGGSPDWGDNPNFVQAIFDTLAAGNQRHPGVVLFDTYEYEDPKHALANLPNARALYKKLWT